MSERRVSDVGGADGLSDGVSIGRASDAGGVGGLSKRKSVRGVSDAGGVGRLSDVPSGSRASDAGASEGASEGSVSDGPGMLLGGGTDMLLVIGPTYWLDDILLFAFNLLRYIFRDTLICSCDIYNTGKPFLILELLTILR